MTEDTNPTIAEQLANLRETGITELDEHVNAAKELAVALGTYTREELGPLIGRKKRTRIDKPKAARKPRAKKEEKA
jgi:hypothetical protein